MMHISRFAEELILWMNPRIAFIDLPDRFCTGSSIMPQKKNPDIPELARGKSGRVFPHIGHLMALLTLMKGAGFSVQQRQPGRQGTVVRYRYYAHGHLAHFC